MNLNIPCSLQTGARRVCRDLVALLRTAVVCLGLILPGAGFAVDGTPRTYKPGDVVEIGGGQWYRIVSTTGSGEWDDCQVQPLAPGGGAPVGKPVKLSVRNLRAGEARLAKSRGIPAAPAPRSAAPTRPAPAALPPPPAAPAAPVAAPMSSGGDPASAPCNYDPPGPAVTASSVFSAALAKRKIFDAYGWKANGTGSAPLRVGVTFLSFEVGPSYPNTVTNVPGLGAQRRHAGAPPNATIHTLKSRHVVCEEYRDGSVERRLVEGSHGCFITRDGEWTCPSENDTKITPLP